MRIYISDQSKRFSEHLRHLKSKHVSPYNKSSLVEKITAISLQTSKKLDQLDLDFLFNYKIFPEHIMTHYTQWQDEGRKMQIGDTIVQQVYLPPNRVISQKLIFGVRISDIINDPDKKGFSYETLEGHVEKGISTFTIERQNGGLVFKIHTYSSTGNFLARMTAPIFAMPYQAFCTRRALENVKRQIQ